MLVSCWESKPGESAGCSRPERLLSHRASLAIVPLRAICFLPSSKRYVSVAGCRNRSLPMPDPAWTSPRAISVEIGKDISTVLAWIHNGELAAFNLAERVGERPRYKIRIEDWETFLQKRMV